MNEEQRALLRVGEELVVCLKEETFACLRNLETITNEEVEQFLLQRQKRSEELEHFTSNLRMMEESREESDQQENILLENFERFFRSTLKEILEADALIRALAERQKTEIQDELGSVTQGMKAMHGYGAQNDRIASPRNRLA
jgi:hypothetical protein